MEEKINQVHEILKELFPDAVGVRVLVTSNGIEVTPEYKTNLRYCSMRTITGNWVRKSDSQIL